MEDEVSIITAEDVEGNVVEFLVNTDKEKEFKKFDWKEYHGVISAYSPEQHSSITAAQLSLDLHNIPSGNRPKTRRKDSKNFDYRRENLMVVGHQKTKRTVHQPFSFKKELDTVTLDIEYKNTHISLKGPWSEVKEITDRLED